MLGKGRRHWRCLYVGQESQMGEVILVTVLVSTVSATARMLYRHPIRWNTELTDGSDSLANNTR
jgi:hypothetical protein